MNNPTAYIICMNDVTEGVVIDDVELANKLLEKFKKNHKKNIGFLELDLKDYDGIYFWHLHEVSVLNNISKVECDVNDCLYNSSTAPSGEILTANCTKETVCISGWNTHYERGRCEDCTINK